MRVGALRHAADFPASRREVADDVAHVVGGRHDLHVHDRLEQDGGRLTGGLFHRHGPRDLERHFARVYVVVRPVHQLDYHVHHRIAGEHAVLERLLDALLDRADVFPRDHAAYDVVLEDEARAGLARRHMDDHVPVLAAAAGLADELALHVLDALAHRLAVGHLRSAHVGVDLELALHALDQDFQVQLAHPGDDRLRRLGVAMNAERRIFLGELLLVGLGLGLDGDRDHRLGELHRLEDDGVALVTQRVAGLRVLQPDGRRDVARAHLFDFLALVRVHLQQPADALLLVLGAVIDVGAGGEHARIDPEERQLPHVRIGHDLEREGGERLLVSGLAQRVRGVVVRQVALDRRNVGGRGQVVHHGVEQRLDALVLEGGAREYRDDFAGDRRLPQHGADLVLGQLVLLEILVQDGVVLLDDRLEQVVARLLHLVLQGGRHGSFDILFAERVVVVHDLHLPDQVDDAGEELARAERQVDRHDVGAEPLPHHLDAHLEVRAHAVHLVHEDDARHVVAVRLAPHGFGLRLDDAHRVEHGHGAVADPQAALHLDGEVHVAGGVDDVDAVLLAAARPEGRGGGGSDGDAALLLLLHPVHGGGAVVHLTQLVRPAGVVQDPLGRSRFPGIDVGHDADVANLVERCGARHSSSFTQQKRGATVTPMGAGLAPPSSVQGRSTLRPYS